MYRFKIGVVLMIFIIGCDLNPFSDDDTPKENPPVYVYNFDTLSAMMASWYFETQYPDSDLAQKISDDIHLIDSVWNDSISAWSNWVKSSLHPDNNVTMLEFIPPYKFGLFELRISASLSDSMFAEVNNEIKIVLDSIEYDSLVWDDGIYYGNRLNATLYLKDLQHPLLIARKFTHTEAIERIYLKEISQIGEYSNLIPYLDNGKYKYFYYFRFGDCDAGCINNHIFYFEVINNQVVLHGIHDNRIYVDWHFEWVDTLINLYYNKWRYHWYEELNG